MGSPKDLEERKLFVHGCGECPFYDPPPQLFERPTGEYIVVLEETLKALNLSDSVEAFC